MSRHRPMTSRQKHLQEKHVHHLDEPFISRMIKLPFRMLWRILRYLMDKIVTILLMFGISGGITYALWTFSPEFQEKAKQGLALVDTLMDQSGSEVLGLENLNLDSLKSTLDSTKLRRGTPLDPEVPAVLNPFLEVIMPSAKYPAYRERLKTEVVGADGVGAIPILAKALGSSKKDIREGALDALKRIDNDDAYEYVKAYEVNQALGTFGRTKDERGNFQGYDPSVTIQEKKRRKALGY